MTTGLLDFEGRNYDDGRIMLGEQLGIYDTVNRKDERYYSLYQRAAAQFWVEDEFSFVPCKKEFEKGGVEADMMIETISYQWEADSAAAGAILTVFAPFISRNDVFQLFAFNTQMECLTPDHEVYVKGKGWVGIADVNIGDEVIQYDIETKKTSIGKVSDTIAKEHDPSIPLIKFKGRYFSQTTTPEHRMVQKCLYKKTRGVEPYQNVIREAKSAVMDGHTAFVVAGEKEDGLKNHLTPTERLWIAFQADGTYVKDERYTGARTGGLPIRFSIKKSRKKERLEEIIKATGYHCTFTDTPSKPGFTGYIVYIPKEDFTELGKTFGWVDVSTVTGNWCKEFIEEINHWDGCDRTKRESIKMENPSRPYSRPKRCLTTYTNSNEEACDVVSLVSHLAGYRCTWTKYLGGRPGINNIKDWYQLSINDIDYQTANTINKETIEYEGKVYCITVPTGAFLVRRVEDGVKTLSITGNCIHAGTYSNIVRDAFDNPNEVMDTILANQGALERVSITNKVMGEVYETSLLYAQGKISKEEAFPRVYKGMVGLLLLERLQFIASFAVTFCLGEMGIFQPIAMAVRKICSDEYNIHCETDLMVLADLRKMEYWEKTNTPEFQAQVKAMVDDTVQAELEWTEYLFRDDRKLVGMTKKQLQDWVHFNAAFIYKQLGFVPPVVIKENPLPWMDNWMSTANLQAAPQEQEIANYLVGQLADDTDDMEFEV